jgi:hypothetical protein
VSGRKVFPGLCSRASQIVAVRALERFQVSQILTKVSYTDSVPAEIDLMVKSERLAEAKRETEAKAMIFLAITEWRDDEGTRIVNNLDSCDDLADKLFKHLKVKGLLKLEDDGT